MARILLVDSDQQSIEQINAALQADEHQTIAIDSAAAATRILRRDRFDMLLLGIKDDSIRICATVRTDPLRGKLPIICLITPDDLESRLSCFRAGADDCIGKPFEPAELAARVKAILHRTQQDDDSRHTQFLALEGRLAVDPLNHTVQADEQAVQLTPLEFQVLFKLVCAAGRPCSREHLIEAVWGYAPGTGDPALLRSQIKNLRHKLSSIDSSVEWVLTVPNNGYTVPA